MRFSAAVQNAAPRATAPVTLPAPPRDEATLQKAADPCPPYEVPLDLDQRVRLTGEW